jgi:muconolactone delta-isomerase
VSDEAARRGRGASEGLLAMEYRALGLWQAGDAGQMQAIVDARPLTPWMTTQVAPLSEHPSDPAVAG